MTLTPLVQRIIALGLLALVGVALHIFVIEPYRNRLAAREEQISRTRALVERYQRLARDRDAVERRAARLLAERDDEAQGYLSGGEPTIAAAGLQKSMRSIIEALGGTIRSMRVLPPETEGGLQRIAVNGQLEIGHDSLRDLLHEIETRESVLLIDEIEIRERRQRLRGLVQGERDAPDLSVTLTVAGFLAEEAPAS